MVPPAEARGAVASRPAGQQARRASSARLGHVVGTGVCETNIPFTRALAI